MIQDDKFPENISEEDLDKLYRRGRWGAPAIIGGGAIAYINNELTGSRGRKKAYKRLKRGGIATMIGGAGLMGANEYIHYKYKKRLKNDNKEKKD